MIIFLPLILILHLLLLGQLTFTAWPEMLSYPYLFTHGFTFYRDFILPYPPGLVFVLSAIFQVFGFTPEVLKIFTQALILIVDGLLFLVLKKVTQNNLVSLLFLLGFILLQSFLEGNMLWFDSATVPPLVAGFWAGLKWLEKKDGKYLFLTALFLSLAIIIKQIAIVYFMAFLIFYFGQVKLTERTSVHLLIRKKFNIKELGLLAAGFLILVVPLLGYLLEKHSLIYFWNWTLFYPLAKWSNFPGYVDFAISKKYALVSFILISPIIGIFFQTKKIFQDKVFLLASLFLIAAVLAIYPRFSFFHLQPSLTFAMIIFARIFVGLPQNKKTAYKGLVTMAIILIIGLTFQGSIGEKMRFYDQSDQKLAAEIQKSTKNSVFLLGLNSSQYVFANRLPPKHWSDNFGWYLEIPGVQEWFLEGFSTNMPEKVFWRIPNSGKWYELGVYQPQQITQFIRQHYEKTDKIEGGIEVWTPKKN